MEQKQNQAKDKANKTEPPLRAEELPQSSPVEYLPGQLAASGSPGDIRQRQCQLLADHRLDRQQRQKMAAQIGRVQGNQHLQQLMLQIETPPEAGWTAHLTPPTIQRDLPNKSAPVTDPVGPGRAPSTRDERQQVRGSDDPADAAQESEQARLSQWALDNWIRGERNLRVSVPAEEGHSEEGPRVLEWRTLFLGAGREAFAVTEDPADPGTVFHWLDNLAEENADYLGRALEAMGTSIFQSRLEQFRVDWTDFRASLAEAREDGVEGAWAMAHQFMRIDEAMTGFFENQVGLTPPDQPAGVEATAPEEAGPGELTQQQVAGLRRLAEEMDYSTLHQGYTDLNRWLASHNWLTVIKHGIQRTDGAVDSYFQSATGSGGRPETATLDRLKLTSKMVGNKGRLDKIMLAVYALQAVEGTEDVARFDAFLNYWENEGWSSLMTFYDEFRGDQPRLDMSADQYLGEGTSSQRRVEIGIQVGRVLELQPGVRLSVVQASVRETLDIAGTLAFFGIEEIFLNRIPGWAWIKLAGEGVIAIVNAFSG